MGSLTALLSNAAVALKRFFGCFGDYEELQDEGITDPQPAVPPTKPSPSPFKLTRKNVGEFDDDWDPSPPARFRNPK
jgi:hypothetical protein